MAAKTEMGSNGVRQLLLFFFVLSAFSALTLGVNGQLPSTEGFISIDCGIPSNSSYIDGTTGIPYTSDEQYIDIDSGINYNISSDYVSDSLPEQLLNVRSFPTGARNCYTLPVIADQKYLVRATFMYGNYDGKNSAGSSSPILFQLHLDVNVWATINISNPLAVDREEVFAVPTTDILWVCLVNTGTGTPFISALELRPLNDTLYPYATATQPLVLFLRLDMGSLTNEILRYPNDTYDRIWAPYNGNGDWGILSSNSTISYFSGDFFLPPASVMQTAVTPINSTSLLFNWSSTDVNGYYITLYFTELQNLTSNMLRGFYVYLDGQLWYPYFSPPYLLTDYIYTVGATIDPQFNFNISMAPNATLPPLMNALEVYTPLLLTIVPTDLTDVKRIMEIRAQYQLKLNWEGDPCNPEKYAWDGLNCSYNFTSPRIISIDLTASGLKGNISDSFAMLNLLQDLYLSSNKLDGTIPDSLGDLSSLMILDLSNNSLTGTVPDSLGNLSSLSFLDLSSNSLTGTVPDSLGSLLSLKFLDLSYNNLTGSVPDSLGNLSLLHVLNLTGNNLSGIPDSILKRSQNGSLILRYDNNTANMFSEVKHKKTISTTVIIIIAVGGAVLLFLTVLIVWGVIFWLIRRRSTAVASNGPVLPPSEWNFGQRTVHVDHPIQFDSRQFTYLQLVNITNNFARVIGKGRFGIVYKGHLQDGTQVAVKLRSQSSPQGTEEFRVEAHSLTRVHHKNLVSLFGYCKDGDYLGLLYEYMAQGSLHEHLRGRGTLSRSLNWGERLHIALDAAQGLEYLHYGCLPPIIHKDVRTANILLGENLEAKLVDFGLSRSFYGDEDTVVATHGYLDPEYFTAYQLTEKSDVYSFGVVLLELITGQLPVQRGRHKGHIIKWVAPHFTRGNIDEIVDQRLQGDYNAQSIWKVMDLAMKCIAESSARRPTTADVVVQLKDGLALETAYDSGVNENDGGLNPSRSAAFEFDGNISESSAPAAR